jgi:hypothetical protein
MENSQERHQRELFKLIHETALTAGLVIIEDKINRRGGVCRLDEKVMVIYDVHAPARERNRLILNGLKLLDLEHIYVPPKIRELLTDKNASDIKDQDSQENMEPAAGKNSGVEQR